MPGAVYTPLLETGLPVPAAAPVDLELIMPGQCAAITRKGIQAHIAEDMRPRLDAVESSLKLLGIKKTY